MIELKKLFVLLIFIFEYSISYSQNIKFSGCVKSVYDKSNLSYSSIKFQRDTLTTSISYAIADEGGCFTLNIPSNIESGYLKVSSIGYQDKIFFIDLKKNGNNLVFYLERNVGELPTILIKTEPAIKISGDTISYRVDAFKIGNEKKIDKVISNLPGFQIADNGKIIYNGEQVETVLIEDDDLVDKNYEQFIKHLDANGVNQIQIIRNYKDPNNLLSQFKNSNKLALNIKYKKKYLLKIFGSIEEGIGPDGFYNSDIQIVSLIQKLKIVAVQSNNTIGNEGTIENNTIMEDETASNTEDISLIQVVQPKAIASISEEKNNITNHSIFSSNNSNYSTLNFLGKITKKLSIKGDIIYQHDTYPQYIDDRTTIITPIGNIIQSQNRQLLKEYFQSKNNIRINYLPNKKNQIAILGQIYANNENDRDSVFLQEKKISEKFDFRPKQFAIKGLYTHIFNHGGAFTMSGLLQQKNNLGSYLVSPSSYSNFFFDTTALYDLNQTEQYHETSSLISASYLKKNSRHSYAVKLITNFNTKRFFNSLNVIQNTNSFYINPDSTNNVTLTEKFATLSVSDSKKISKSFSLTYGIDGRVIHIERNNPQKNIKYDNLFFLPRLSLSYQISNLDRLSISYNYDNAFPKPKNISSGFYLNGLTSIGKGVDSIHSLEKESGQLIFSHIDLIDKQILLFCGLVYSKTPQLYLLNQTPLFYYNIDEFTISNRYQRTTSIFIRSDKFINGLNNKISPEISYVLGNSFAMQKNIEFETRYTQLHVGLGGQVKKNKILIKGNFNYTISSQRQNNIQNTFSRYDSKASINAEIAPQLYIDVSSNYALLNSENYKPVSIFLSDAELLYNSKNQKWAFSIKATNIFNQQKFSQIYLSPAQEKIVGYNLFPRVIIGSVKYSF